MKNIRKSKDIFLIIGLIILIIVIVSQLPSKEKNNAKNHMKWTHSSTETTPSGTKALYYYLKNKKNVKVNRYFKKLNTLKIDSDVLFVISPVKPFTKDELYDLYDWVWKGHTLVYTFPDYVSISDFESPIKPNSNTEEYAEPHSLAPFPIMLDLYTGLPQIYTVEKEFKSLDVYKKVKKLDIWENNAIIYQPYEYHPSLKELKAGKKKKSDDEIDQSKYYYEGYNQNYNYDYDEYNYSEESDSNLTKKDPKKSTIEEPKKEPKVIDLSSKLGILFDRTSIFPYYSVLKINEHNLLIYSKIGAGQIIVGSNSYLFVNYALPKEDNMVFIDNLVDILGKDKSYTFSEYHNIRAEKSAIPDLLRESDIFPFILYGLLLLFIFYWMTGKYFGSYKVKGVEKRRSILEHINAVSNMYLRSKKSYYLLEKNYEYFKHKIRKQFNIYGSKTDSELADYLSKRSGIYIGQLTGLFNAISFEIQEQNHDINYHFDLINKLDEISTALLY